MSLHTTVLLKEVIENLNPKAGGKYLDCTINGGGHSEAIIDSSLGEVTIIGIDEDGNALQRAEQRLSGKKAKLFLHKGNFKNLDTALKEAGVEKVNGIVFDFGLSSTQLEGSGRGFSFMREEPLIMTLNEKPENSLTALEIINSWEEESLANMIYELGEETRSRRIAKAIVTARKIYPISTTAKLREIIHLAIGNKSGKIDSATKTFQAIRIAVNDELHSIEVALPKAIEALEVGGRVAIISFHSLEDRIVKNFLKERAKLGGLKILTNKPIIPQDEEIKNNPRSRSAKMRVAEKII